MVEGAVGAIFLKRGELGGKVSVFEETGSRRDVQVRVPSYFIPVVILNISFS